MKRFILTGAVAAILAGWLFDRAIACGPYEPTPAQLAAQAISSDERQARPAIEALRSQGPAGLAALCDYHSETLAKYAADGSLDRNDPNWRRLTAAHRRRRRAARRILSQLYWHTDMDAALKGLASRAGRSCRCVCSAN